MSDTPFPIQSDPESRERVTVLVQKILETCDPGPNAHPDSIMEIVNALAAASAIIVVSTKDKKLERFFHMAFDRNLGQFESTIASMLKEAD